MTNGVGFLSRNPYIMICIVERILVGVDFVKEFICCCGMARTLVLGTCVKATVWDHPDKYV